MYFSSEIFEIFKSTHLILKCICECLLLYVQVILFINEFDFIKDTANEA